LIETLNWHWFYADQARSVSRVAGPSFYSCSPRTGVAKRG
jgi:hypothetical protein